MSDKFILEASIAPTAGEGNIIFLADTTEKTPPVLELRANGDILVKGKLIEHDKQIVDAMREFLDAMRVREEKAICARHSSKPTALVHRFAYNQVVEELSAARREIEELQAKLKSSAPADEHDDWGHIGNST